MNLDVSVQQSGNLDALAPASLPGFMEAGANESEIAMGRIPGLDWANTGGSDCSVSHLVRFTPSDAVSRRSASWGAVTGEVVEARRRGRLESHFHGPVHVLAVYERGTRESGSTHVEGNANSTLRNCRRKLVFVPAGCGYHEWQEPRTLPRTAYFYFDPARLAPQLDPSGMALTPRLFFEDSAVWETALKLVALIDGGARDNRRYAEALCNVLVHELVLHTLGDRRDTRVQGGLAAWQKQKVAAYIGEHLAAPIPLATLAQMVRLSPNYFCRAFSQSFGMPPQRYQIAQRIERAKALLATHSASVTDIGITVGYSETSAFSTAFRRVTGLTPSAYRMSPT